MIRWRAPLVLVVVAGAGAAAAGAAGCTRVGDDRYPRLPDARLPDAVSLTPDAAGPVDAPAPPDAAAADP